MQYPPIESSQTQFPLTPITDFGPYCSPLPWYGSQEEGVGDLSTLPCYETAEDNGWSYEPFSWFDFAKRDYIPLVCNDFQQQAGEKFGTDPFNLIIDPMLAATGANYEGAPDNQTTDTNEYQRERRDSGYESGTVTSPELPSVGELEETQVQSAQHFPPGSLHRFRLSRAPKLSITKHPVGNGNIPRDCLLRFRLGRPEPATDASARTTMSTPMSSTTQQRPRKPPTKTPKPKRAPQTNTEKPKPKRALNQPHCSTRSPAVAYAWLLSCCKRLNSPSQLHFPLSFTSPLYPSLTPPSSMQRPSRKSPPRSSPHP